MAVRVIKSITAFITTAMINTIIKAQRVANTSFTIASVAAHTVPSIPCFGYPGFCMPSCVVHYTTDVDHIALIDVVETDDHSRINAVVVNVRL